MDITMLPPSNILSNHSHHLYHQLPLPILQSTSPRRTCGLPSGFTFRHPRIHHYEPEAPYDGSSPFMNLPDELILEIFRYLDWKQLLPLYRTCERLKSLATSGSLHHSLTLTTLPPYPLSTTLIRILPNVKHLHLQLLPYPSTSTSATRTVLAILDHISPDQLLSLSLPFSAPYLTATELGRIISRLGGTLERLDLRGSGLAGKGWLDWIGAVGQNGKGLMELDLGFTNITDLPSFTRPISSPTLDRPPEVVSAFRSLTTLSLASCTSLSASAIYNFLSSLPPTIATLDISRLEQTSYEALKNMSVARTALREIKVVGIDHLTRLDIRRLKHHWESQRRDHSPLVDEDGEELVRARVWGEPRTPDQTIFSIPPRTPESLPRLSSPPGSTSGSGSGSEPSSLGSTSSRLHESVSPRLLTPESFGSELPNSKLERKHPFLTDLRSRARYPLDSPISIPTPDHPGTPRVVGDEYSINIIHSAILESEDEAGYRQFIGEVAGGTVGLGLGHGYGLGMRWINR